MVSHRADRGVRPDVFRRFHHVDDGVDREDDAHEAHRRADAGHEGKGEEVAAHGDAGIADSGEHGDEEPRDHGAHGEFKACVLHDEERRDEDECRAAVHIDGGADRQDEAGHFRIDFQILLGAGERYRQGTGGALREERDRKGRSHFAEYPQRIQAAQGEDERENEEDLDGVAAEDDESVLAERAHDDARFNLSGELSREGDDAYRQDDEERADEGKRQFLKPLNDFHQLFAVFRVGHESQREAGCRGDQHDGKDVACREGQKNVIGDDGKNVVIIRKGFEIIHRHGGLAGSEQLHREIARRDIEIEAEADRRGADGGEKRVEDGVHEDAARFFIAAQFRQCRDDGQEDRGDGDELEETGEDRRYEIEKFVQRLNAHPAEDAAEDQRAEPERELTALIFRPVLPQGFLGGLADIMRSLCVAHFFSLLLRIC